MIVKCANGHFYDSAKSRDCPYCAKREQERSDILGQLGDVPTFDVRFDNSIHESVTQPMMKGIKEVQLGSGRSGHMQGLGASGDPVTVGIFRKSVGTAYITGWLVCIDGPEKGRDYRIYHGMNWIGKSQNMDIPIHGEGIADQKHCAVVYDGKSNHFFLAKGAGSLTYLNGDLVEGSVQLNSGDEIKIGNGTFEFIPFCREGHIWKLEEESEKL